MEGAGSAVELNLKKHDLVNMAMAEMADAKCILVGDIDRGGIFASLLGSISLFQPSERERVIGFIVNKLRGTPAFSKTAWKYCSHVPAFQCSGSFPTLRTFPCPKKTA